MSCQLRVTPKRHVVNHTARYSKVTVVPAKSTCLLPIRFAGLKVKQDYLLMPVTNNAYLPGGTYVMRSIIEGDQTSVLVTNVMDVPLTIPKGARVGTVESLDNAQETKF
jgi:hypothetical protein